MSSKRLHQTIYKLKRLYGHEISLYKQGDKSVDIRTGDVTWTNRDVTLVKLAIVLPVKLDRTQVQSISMISADKQFIYGGMFDKAARTFFIDPKDLPNDYEIKRDDWIVYRGRKYEIKEISRSEFDLLWQVLGSELVGVIPEQIHELSGYSIVDFQQQAEVEV